MSKLDDLLKQIRMQVPIGPGPIRRAVKIIRRVKAELRASIGRIDAIAMKVPIGPGPIRRIKAELRAGIARLDRLEREIRKLGRKPRKGSR